MSSLNENLKGRDYWRSLEHLAQSPEIEAVIDQEFPGYSPEEIQGLSRRRFLKIMGASMALAGLTLSGCRRWPTRQIRPFAARPEGMVPGIANHYASMMTLGGVAGGLLVKSYDGRPIKIEGNPLHPESKGAASAFAQASILELYDPDRSRRPIQRTGGEARPGTWDLFSAYSREQMARHRETGGRGLAVVAEADHGPTFQRLRAQMLERFPEMTWVTWEPICRDHELEGARLGFGKPVRTHYHLERAQCIACFDADLLGRHPAAQKLARQWSAGRRSADEGEMNRLWSIESDFTMTGAVADHRLPVKPSRVGRVLGALHARLSAELPGLEMLSSAQLADHETKFVEALAQDLLANRGRSLVAVGIGQPAWVHAEAHQINMALENQGSTVTFTEEPGIEADHQTVAHLKQLVERIDDGAIDTLIMLGGNPAYDTPIDLRLSAERLGRVEHTVHLSPYVNETSTLCRWHLPRAHYLECWGDGRAWDGTLSVQQPLILPLFNGRSPIELMALLLRRPQREGIDLVRETFREQNLLPGDKSFEKAWREALHNGVVADSAYATITDDGFQQPLPADDEAAQGLEIVFAADYSVYDGRFANNGWLQEMPDPMTKLTWDNAAFIGPEEARELGLAHGRMANLTGPNLPEDGLNIAVFVMPGIARGTVVLPLGYARAAAGNVGNKLGFDTYALRHSQTLFGGMGYSLSRARGRYTLATTQNHHIIDDNVGRWGVEKRIGKPGGSGYLVRDGSFEQYQRDPNFFRKPAHGNLELQLFEAPHKFNDPHAWGMAIDMNSCIGCNACVMACQAENNVPIVGKSEVANSREMHWIRIDRYFKGEYTLRTPDVIFQPMMCLHCEKAPCEQVCPVAATVHDTEGLNTMVYNRCIGTRYCSNNCPYKVRRFNYFDYQAKDPRGMAMPWLGIPDQQQREVIDSIKQMVFNPEVTVRMRGVMEKCTFCTQRIADAKRIATVEYRRNQRQSETLTDGEVVVACQQSCPTEAIVFGDLNDPNSRVSRLMRGKRTYEVLRELNNQTRGRHMAKVRNPAFDPYDG
ncbi:MAG: TAT-variant-translocated molybdopterin oxidoreductase [Phycisphaeraceae bacterium]|nr:TAT-variant-translocated molybdopterin oxidoreductase [Phycisphaeraceae bacterium]